MDDLISRWAAIDAVQNRHMMLSKEKVLLIKDLEKLPSAQPKSGIWIPYSNIYKNRNYCSECRYHLVGTPAHEANFCPHCGAKMEVTE